MEYKHLKITKIIEEGKDIKTFLFDENVRAKPGQFVMAWIPGVAEKPFSLSYNRPLGITVKKQKNPSSIFTPALFELKEKDNVWIRGPCGNGFSLGVFGSSNVYIIGGGIGIAPLALLVRELFTSNITCFIGAKSADELIFEKRLEKVGEVRVATEDGSKGKKGLVTDLLKDYKFPSYVKVAICGPERMIYNSAKILERSLNPNNIYVSLERYMKCGNGLCGSCDFGGYRVCVDGPVFAYNEIKDILDFGRFKRDASGSKEFL